MPYYISTLPTPVKVTNLLAGDDNHLNVSYGKSFHNFSLKELKAWLELVIGDYDTGEFNVIMRPDQHKEWMTSPLVKMDKVNFWFVRPVRWDATEKVMEVEVSRSHARTRVEKDWMVYAPFKSMKEVTDAAYNFKVKDLASRTRLSPESIRRQALEYSQETNFEKLLTDALERKTVDANPTKVSKGYD